MRNFIKLDLYNGHTQLITDPDSSEFIGMIHEPKGRSTQHYTNVWSRPGWMIMEIPRELHEPVEHQMNVAGKQVVSYEIDCFGYTNEDLKEMLAGDGLCFTYAVFEDGRSLTDDQLGRLSRKYPKVLADLVSQLDERV